MGISHFCVCCVYLTALCSYMTSYHAGAGGACCWHGTRGRELRLLPSVRHFRLSHSAEMISSSRKKNSYRWYLYRYHDCLAPQWMEEERERVRQRDREESYGWPTSKPHYAHSTGRAPEYWCGAYSAEHGPSSTWTISSLAIRTCKLVDKMAMTSLVVSSDRGTDKVADITITLLTGVMHVVYRGC